MKHEHGDQLVEDPKSLIEQNIRLKSELAEARGFLEAIVEHIPEAITIVDGRDLTVRMVSKFGLELLGHPKEKVEGITYQEYSKIQDFFNTDGAPTPCEELPLIRATLNGELVTNEEWLLRRSDGVKLNLLCNSSPILDRHGNVIAGIVVWRDITEHKRVEQELRTKNIVARKNMEQELQAKSYRLQEVNAALKALLRQRDEDRKEFEEALLINIENLILPYIKRLKSGPLSSTQASLLEILESHLKELSSKFGKTLALEYRVLTPTEMRIAALVRDGKTSKEIADLLCISEKTASFHRNNIRTKLGMRGTGANLRSHLLSLT
ncbi:MAG: LuxR C-terminal-related transcriptional regulator [Syntrophobacteraceae bacterium]|jgi:PAS domain S-box-containing protein